MKSICYFNKHEGRDIFSQGEEYEWKHSIWKISIWEVYLVIDKYLLVW